MRDTEAVEPDARDAVRARHHAMLERILAEFFHIDDAAVLHEIEDALDYVALEASHRLFEQGDEADDVFFLLSGRLRALLRDERGRETVLGEVARGETVGELAMVMGERRGASVVAVRDCVLARLPRDAFERILMGRPRAAMAVTRTVVERFRKAEATRARPARPINLCLMPISEGIDLRAFARSLADALRAYVNPVGVLTREDFERGGSQAGDFRAWLREREAQAESVLLVAEGHDAEWTRRCAHHADEIVLVGRADGDGAWSFAEEVAEPDRDRPGVARRTLVLLHGRDAGLPADTARWFAPRDVARHLHIRSDVEGDMQRLARTLTGRAVGLVLAGGGGRGMAHVGVIAAFEEAGLAFDMVGGTSIGGVISAIHASGLGVEGLQRMVRRIFVDAGSPTNDYNLLPLVSLIKARKAYGRTLEAIADEFGTAAPGAEDLRLPWFAVAANYYTGAETVLTRGPLARLVFASLAIPGAFPPMVVDRQLYVDGGTVNNMPVDVMERMGANAIVAVDLMWDRAREVDYEWVPTTRQLLADRLRPRARRQHRVPRLPEILLNASVLHSVSHQKRMRERADLCVRPDMRGIGLLDWKSYARAVERGYAAGRAAIEGMTPEQERKLRGLV